MNKAFDSFLWKNRPSYNTPLSERMLNKLNVAVDEIDDRVIAQDTTKFDKIDAQTLVKSIAFDRTTGVFTITYFNGSTATIDTLLEKLIVNFRFDPVTQRLIITLDDGTEQYVDLSALITQYEFLDSDTITFELLADGKVRAKVKEGSIQEKHLRPDYLADIKVEVSKAQTSAAAAWASEVAAQDAADSAAGSALDAAGSAEAASMSKTEAEASATNASGSANAAAQSATSAAGSAADAISAKDAAAQSAQDAEDSAGQAATSAEEAAGSAEAAETSRTAADASATNASSSADAAAKSAETAQTSEINAAGSATDSENSANAASASAAGAKNSQDAAKVSEDNAADSATAAANSEDTALNSAQNAAGSAADAKTSEDSAAASADQAEDFSLTSKSYAVGTDGEVRPGDATDNSKYYSDLAQYLTDEAAKLLDQAQKLISAATAGALIPSGTVAFENLPTEPKVGYMYNISNSFVTDDRFAEGPGIQYNPGANIYWTADGRWDVMVGVQVTGVKGAAEIFYRQGNVDITPANIGLGNVPNVTTNDQTPTFTQTAARENVNSGDTNSTLWGKVRKWFADLKTVAFTGKYTDLTGTPSIPAAVRVKGNAESAYRDGDVNLTPANLGAMATSGGEFTGDVTFDKYLVIKAWPNYGDGIAKAWYNANTKTIDFEGGVEKIDLKATSAGTADTISSTLPISKGGTGQTTAQEGLEALTSGARTESESYALSDNDSVLWMYTSTGSGATYKTKFAKVWNYIRGKLATVATSGSYNDLSNKPTIPTVGNGTVTIKQAGTSKGSFTMNQSGNTTIELTDNNTVYSLPLAASGTRGGVKTGYTANGKNYPVQLNNEQMYVNVPWTDNNTWKANTAASEGYVAKGSGQANKVWKTDANGVPGWRADANTTYGVVSKTANGLAPKLPNETTLTKFLRQDGTWAETEGGSMFKSSQQIVVTGPIAKDDFVLIDISSAKGGMLLVNYSNVPSNVNILVSIDGYTADSYLVWRMNTSNLSYGCYYLYFAKSLKIVLHRTATSSYTFKFSSLLYLC